MKVINLFPGGGSGSVTSGACPDQKLFLGPVQFTCPHCSNSAELQFANMIFRSIEFNCGTCGTYFKLANPGFVNRPAPKTPKNRR